ncbi:NON-SPECIFIC LIPID-TRANSFER PROTEIN B-LIKE [Salix koriyanagi]|uniref:Non-specific lipid-transfer protein n=1 Tax=Salix koriyanagi TaxID=2511006 RepID=A0A9Q0Z614_9ROSI|nr:NON-SPECIFIC LIPID-TRANSFER PROTEIN B-LIKE [Salix koriyanagi]
MKGAVISMLVLVASVQFMVKPAEAITCGDVDSDLFACVPYLTGKGGDDPPPQCCAGVIKLKNSAVSVADKQAACKCVKAAACRISGIDDAAASSLPANCNVQIDFPISKDFNCAKRLTYHGRAVMRAKPKPEFLFKDHEKNSRAHLIAETERSLELKSVGPINKRLGPVK